MKKDKSFKFFDYVSNPKIAIEQYNPKYKAESPSNYPQVSIFHTKGPCAGIGIRLKLTSFDELCSWYEKHKQKAK